MDFASNIAPRDDDDIPGLGARGGWIHGARLGAVMRLAYPTPHRGSHKGVPLRCTVITRGTPIVIDGFDGPCWRSTVESVAYRYACRPTT